MDKEKTSERLKKIMKIRGYKQVDLLEKCQPYCKLYGEKIYKSHISQWCNGVNEPNQRKLVILAQALGVSEPWLMGYGDQMETSEEAAEVRKEFETGWEMGELLKKYSQLTDENKSTVRQMVDFLLTNQKTES